MTDEQSNKRFEDLKRDNRRETIRIRQLEADGRNLDVAMTRQMDVVEPRLLQIELRIGLRPPNESTPQ
jgi:hypothetical protein